MKASWRSILPLVVLAALSAAPAAAQPAGTVTFAVHVTLATRWLDPAETDSEITPFMIFYALHDALVKPMPASLYTPSLAESWTVSKDGRTWEFVIRKGVRFHNGEPVTAEDVKFSFERYRGAAASPLQGAGARSASGRPQPRALPPERPVARLHDLLRHQRLRRGVDRPQEVLREGRRGRLPAGAHRRRPVQVRELHSPGSSWSWRRSTATGARRPP